MKNQNQLKAVETLEEKNTQTQEEQNKKPYLVSDYEMNQKIANYIIETIESGNVEKWRKTWLCFHGKEELYIMGKTGILPIMLFTGEFINFEKYGLEALNMRGGFYLRFDEIKAHKLHLKKGSKGSPLYKASIFNKYLTQDQKDGLNKAIEEGNKEILTALETLTAN